MGIDYENMLNLTWLEFDYLVRGYEQRMQRNWDFIRNIMAMQVNTSMSKKTVKPREIMSLPYIDTPTVGRVVERMSEEKLEEMKNLLKN